MVCGEQTCVMIVSLRRIPCFPLTREVDSPSGEDGGRDNEKPELRRCLLCRYKNKSLRLGITIITSARYLSLSRPCRQLPHQREPLGINGNPAGCMERNLCMKRNRYAERYRAVPYGMYSAVWHEKRIWYNFVGFIRSSALSVSFADSSPRGRAKIWSGD